VSGTPWPRPAYSSARSAELPNPQFNLTAVLAVLLVVLVTTASWLFLTPPIARSPIELTAFDESLGAARSGVVDVTSVDYRSLEHNLTEIENATTGALRDEVLATLNEPRDRLVADQQVSSTEVIAAALTLASPTRATALIVLRSTMTSLLTPQPTVTRYRVEVTLELIEGRWLLSGLTGR